MSSVLFRYRPMIPQWLDSMNQGLKSVIGGVLSSIAEFYPLVILSIQPDGEMALQNYCLQEPKVAQASQGFKIRCIGEFCLFLLLPRTPWKGSAVLGHGKGDLGGTSLRVW